MRLRKKKSLIDQATDYVESVRPQLESAFSTAVDSTKDFVETTALPLLAEARDKATPVIADAYSDAKDKAAPYISDARDRAESAYADARKNAGPALSDARDKASATLADAYSEAKDKAKDKTAPLVASGTALASAKASSAKELADAKVAQLKGEPVKKGGKLKKIALFAVVAAVVGVVAKKLQDGKAADNWQSSYVPTPAPAAPAAPVAVADDSAGSSPDEALADAAEAPHPVTTPDDPAEVVSIDGQPDGPIDGAAPEDEPTESK